ncbi:SDR family oxidoreductase [Marinomonas ostreistagni]|uniref:SDR family oxidoreductase n=1 Tax=Marinomonas ostreistagni TaxID=359209 RepID=A0ABS0ZDB1_9GAMM|nr:SDR family oxidoreductase [Marinomonas ostreistagni]MBJ7551656.1 SDR family oxidoreductase [Marinomonas ostreistagni]
MSKKVVLITGASRGIGAATAKLFAQHGYDVCLNYKSNRQAAESLQREILSLGVKCVCVAADVADEAQVVSLFEAMDCSLGPISVLVNNAAILQPQARLKDMSAERVNQMFCTNVTSAFICAREAVKRMSTQMGGQGGVIVNVSSVAARTGSPNEYIDYAASKGALDTLTKGLAMEVAAEGIRVNSVRPGLIYTDMHRDGGEPNRVDRLASKLPMQRGGQASEVAEAIYWLASDKSSFATGNFIDLAGGL